MPAAPSDRLDPARCPLCAGPNACAMERQRATGEPQPACWCTQATFAPDLRTRVPAEARDRTCICAACAGHPAR